MSVTAPDYAQASHSGLLQQPEHSLDFVFLSLIDTADSADYYSDGVHQWDSSNKSSTSCSLRDTFAFCEMGLLKVLKEVSGPL